MSTLRLTRLTATALAISISTSYAGPCTSEIEHMQGRIDAGLDATAAAGPTARESTAATMHRQPTPGSIAAAEERLGSASAGLVDTLKLAMARARAADGAGDETGCEQALADAQRAIER
jgi:hypothetical protein